MSELYGASGENGDKKMCRVTVSLSSMDLEFVSEIADAKSLSNSEVINLLIKPAIRRISEQEKLIKTNPKAVAFDLITKG
ncbi:MAG: hypothetical protein LBP40_04030 [Campylobacteraceae bacterium]|jgi:hypothetical protein|nr:hypothetical protein [Campylobacteraceae bacterium]